MRYLLGIDIGTTATKAVLLNPSGDIAKRAQRPTQLHSRHEGWAEEDPDEWWDNTCQLCQELSSGNEIAGLAVSGMVPCVILTDATGRPLRLSIQQNDARADVEIGELKARLRDARVLQRTGAEITQQSIGPTIMWLAKHEPQVLARAAHLFGSYDYITYRLTGTKTLERNWALESGFLDLETGRWGTDLLQACGVNPAWLPPVHSPADHAGMLTPEAARRTGLPQGLPVFVGSADHVASALAAGAIDTGDVVVKLGGAGDILFVSDRQIADPRLFLDYHLLPNKYLPNGCMASSGSLVRWFQAELAGGASLATLDAEAAEAGPAAGGIVALPYFLGEKTPINDPLARGAFVGLHLAHTRGHLFRAVLESVAFGFRHHLDVFSELGLVPNRIRVTDGGSRSRIWTQLMSDVLRYPLERVQTIEGSAMGAAFVAGIGCGVFGSWEDAGRFISISDTVEPQHPELYDRPYRLYRELYLALREVQLAAQ